jgi:catechol 2,3-dioxygenase-like lactoylglutathione lyase family enzyme
VIDHLGISVSNYKKSKAFYEKVLATLGYHFIMEVTPDIVGKNYWACGFGVDHHPSFWVNTGGTNNHGMHIAFKAAGRAQVDAFYRAAIAAGAKDNGAPGLRTHYHEHYYGAFVLDLDGCNIEAVCHAPEAN